MASVIDPQTESAPAQGEGNGSAAMTERLRSLSFAKDGKTKSEWKEPLAPKRRGLRYFIVAILLMAAAAYGIGRSKGWFRKVKEVEVVAAESQLSTVTLLDTSGFLMTKQKVQINSKVPGTIVELPIIEGKEVKEGDLLARLDGGEYEADLAAAKAGLAQAKARLAELVAGARPEEVHQAEAMLEQAKARAEFTRQGFDRATSLKETISKQEFERAKSNYDEAAAAVEQQTQGLALLKAGAREEQKAAAQAEVQRAQATVDKAAYWCNSTQIRSPIAGTVLEKRIELGERIGVESIAAGICIVGNLKEMEVEVDVQERELENVHIGQPCRIEPEAYPNRLYKGRVSRIMPVANRQRGVVQVRLDVLNDDDRLLPELNCRIVLLKDGASFTPDDRLRIPKEAIVATPGEPQVFVLDGNFARLRKIELGEDQDGAVIVKNGVFAGEQVILPRGQELKDGDRVRTRVVDNSQKPPVKSTSESETPEHVRDRTAS